MAARYNEHGFGHPILYIFDGQKKALLNRKGYPIVHEAVRFSYEYNEEDDDQCIIEFQTDDPRFAENPALQIDSALFVRWGYISYDRRKVMGPLRMIAIRDTDTKYAADKIVMKLECTDAVSYAKELQHNDIRKSNFIEWLNEVSKGRWKPTVTIYSNSTIMTNEVRGPLVDTKYGDVIVSVENTANFAEHSFSSTKVIQGQSKAVHKAIEDELKFAKDGPFFIDGRDDKIHIHNRNFKQKPIRSLHYNSERGEIITFSPRSNIKANDTEIAKVATIDPTTKEVKYTTSGYIDISKFVTASGGIETAPTTIPTEVVGNGIEKLKDTFFELMTNGNNIEVAAEDYNEDIDFLPGIHLEYSERVIGNDVENFTAPVVDLGFNDNGTFNDGTIDYESINNYAVDETRAPISYQKGWAIDITAQELIALDAAEDELDILLQNDIMEKKQRKFEAKMDIIGDPFIESSKMVKVSGVAGPHSGPWYIVKVIHKLNFNTGYICSLEVIKEPLVVIIEGKYGTQLNSDLEPDASATASNTELKPVETDVSKITSDKFAFPENQPTEDTASNDEGYAEVDIDKQVDASNDNVPPSNIDQVLKEQRKTSGQMKPNNDIV
jgi:hypothetical protein